MHVVMKGIYFDTSTKGKIGKHHHSYRAEVQIDGVRRRARFLTYAAARRWQKMMRSQDDGVYAQQRAEREAERRRQLAELEAERRRRLLERERQKLDALADRMVRAIAVPWETLCRRAQFAPLRARFGEILRRRVEAVLAVHIDSRWKYAKLWTPQERSLALRIDQARRAAFA